MTMPDLTVYTLESLLFSVSLQNWPADFMFIRSIGETHRNKHLWALPSLHWGSLKITLTLPLIKIFKLLTSHLIPPFSISKNISHCTVFRPVDQWLDLSKMPPLPCPCQVLETQPTLTPRSRPSSDTISLWLRGRNNFMLSVKMARKEEQYNFNILFIKRKTKIISLKNTSECLEDTFTKKICLRR